MIASGIERITATSLGSRASAQNPTPMATPTRRAATPVISTIDTLLE